MINNDNVHYALWGVRVYEVLVLVASMYWGSRFVVTHNPGARHETIFKIGIVFLAANMLPSALLYEPYMRDHMGAIWFFTNLIVLLFVPLGMWARVKLTPVLNDMHYGN